jgi:hypothetical protein
MCVVYGHACRVPAVHSNDKQTVREPNIVNQTLSASLATGQDGGNALNSNLDTTQYKVEA